MKYTYLLINLASVTIPFLASFHPKLRFDKNWFAWFPANIICTVLFLIWDIGFTKAGIWGFNPDYLLGIYFFNLPLEEVLFFCCIPYACTFSYHSIFRLWKDYKYNASGQLIISSVITVVMVAGLLLYTHQMYTAATAGLLILFILRFGLVGKREWMYRIYICYCLMLLPFMIVNGLLTGSWIAQPVVWYNPVQIIGLRLGTIPVEDVFYGLLLIGINIGFYEYFLNKKQRIITS